MTCFKIFFYFFFPLEFEYDMARCRLWVSILLCFSKPPRFMVWCLTFILENSQSLLIQILLLLLFSFILLFLLPMHYTFYYYSIVLQYSVLYVKLLSFYFNWEVSVVIAQTHHFFFWLCMI